MRWSWSPRAATPWPCSASLWRYGQPLESLCADWWNWQQPPIAGLCLKWTALFTTHTHICFRMRHSNNSILTGFQTSSKIFYRLIAGEVYTRVSVSKQGRGSMWTKQGSLYPNKKGNSSDTETPPPSLDIEEGLGIQTNGRNNWKIAMVSMFYMFVVFLHHVLYVSFSCSSVERTVLLLHELYLLFG